MIELADTSAWVARRRDQELDEAFAGSVRRGVVGTCRQVVVELLVSARSRESFAALHEGLDALRDFPIRRREWDRAADVMYALLEQGKHRSVKLPDLVIAAAAEAAGVPVLHYDRDFELISEITGQEVRSLAPLGSL